MWYGDPNAAAERQPPDLLLASLEQLRDFYDRRGEGVALIVAQHASWSRLKETTLRSSSARRRYRLRQGAGGLQR